MSMFFLKSTRHFKQLTGARRNAGFFVKTENISNLERVGGIEPPTKPWEGLVLPLNHTRRRFAVYALLAVLASCTIAVSSVRAEETTTVTPYHFDENLIASGWVLPLPSGGNLTVFPGVLPTPADVLWTTTTDKLPAFPTNLFPLGKAYRLTITGLTSLAANRNTTAALPDTKSYWQKNIWIYDLGAKSWTKLSTKLNTTTGKLQGSFASLDAYVLVFEDHTTELGNATWYCKNHCSPGYPKLHGTSNDFPVGSYVTVTNPANNAAVTVKIISRWGQPAGRIIDLSWSAYAALKPSSAQTGVMKVIVRPKGADATVTKPVVTATTSKRENLPNLKVTALKNSGVPVVTAASYRVVDAATGTVLTEKQQSTVYPIASISKIMTAVVFLDTSPNMQAAFTYSKSDGTGTDSNGNAYGYNNLTVRAGDKMKVRDLFYATLVGSANNGATALVRAAGLTRAEFVARMNAKAKLWGMNDTKFVEPSGLDAGNISSAKDIAILGNRAFHDYEPIRYVTTKSTYTFVASLSGRHTVKTTDKLLITANGLTVTGGKTGYLDEAKYTYVVRMKNPQGAQVVVSLLGSTTSATRFNEAASLTKWAWSNFTWS